MKKQLRSLLVAVEFLIGLPISLRRFRQVRIDQGRETGLARLVVSPIFSVGLLASGAHTLLFLGGLVQIQCLATPVIRRTWFLPNRQPWDMEQDMDYQREQCLIVGEWYHLGPGIGNVALMGVDTTILPRMSAA